MVGPIVLLKRTLDTHINRKEEFQVKSTLETLMVLIEDARRKLNDTANHKNLTDPEIVKLSQKLDHLLNEYYSSQYGVA